MNMAGLSSIDLLKVDIENGVETLLSVFGNQMVMADRLDARGGGRVGFGV